MYASPKRSTLLSGLLHAVAVAAILIATGVRPPQAAPPHVTFVTPRDVIRYVTSIPQRPDAGGGGGVRSDTAATKGQLPKAALRVFTPPVAKFENFNPILIMDPAILGNPEITMANIDLARLGDPHGVSGPPSGGPGSGGGIGDGHGPGVGTGDGPGAGPGHNGGISAETGFRGTIIEPVLLWKIEPEFTEEARRAKLQGVVILHIEIDVRGQPQNITVKEGLGLGLDERAIESVRRWKFRPGYGNGKPIVTSALVQVNFRLL